MAILTVPGYASDSPLIPYFSAGVDYTQNMKTYSVNKTKYTYDDGSSFRTSSYTDVSNMYKQNDIGALFGMGFLMKTEGWMYTLDVRYRFGLTNINNFRPDNPGNDFTTNVLSVSLAYLNFTRNLHGDRITGNAQTAEQESQTGNSEVELIQAPERY
jgi:outer membrane protein W